MMLKQRLSADFFFNYNLLFDKLRAKWFRLFRDELVDIYSHVTKSDWAHLIFSTTIMRGKTWGFGGYWQGMIHRIKVLRWAYCSFLVLMQRLALLGSKKRLNNKQASSLCLQLNSVLDALSGKFSQLEGD